jgi:phage baseplate assembly protein W
MVRQDYSFPFRIDPTSRRAAQAPDYPTHVDHLIRQLLLTDPGERADLPEFGCGLRRLIFAPFSEALGATTEILVRQSITRWLADQVTLQKVTVLSAALTADSGELVIRIDYVLLETQTVRGLEVLVQ